MTRSRWHLATTSLVLVWLAAAVAVALAHRYISAASWLMVHLLLLGAVTNAVLIWSSHFSAALLRLPASKNWRPDATRLVALNMAVVLVIGGVTTAATYVTAIGALLLAIVVAAHGYSLVRALRKALPSRFGATVHYYVMACGWLIIGVVLGVLLSRGSLDASFQSRIMISHVTVNVLGWIGFSVVGTLVTLWPTMLRTRIAEEAQRAARLTLPILTGAVALATLGALTGMVPLSLLGLVGYLIGLGVASRPMLRETVQRRPDSFATWSVFAAWLWLLICLVTYCVILALSWDFETAAERTGYLAGVLIVGFVAQTLAGALSYLIPAMIGGGPRVVRWRNSVVDRGAMARVVATNTALLVWLLPTPSAVRVTTSAIVLICLTTAGVLVARSMLRPPASDPAALDTRAVVGPRHNTLSGGLAVGVAVTVLAVAVGVGVDPAAVGIGATTAGSAGAGVPVTGDTTTAAVEMKGMRFVPAEITVPAGNTLVIEVTNSGEDTHDLVLDTGQRTDRLAPGESARLEVGPVGRPLEGWCSIAGHRQMGMTLAVIVTGSAPHNETTRVTSQHEHPAPEGTDEASAARDLDLMAAPGQGFRARDARLAPTPRRRTHRIELRVQALVEEVAPGVTQTRWTFGGSVPGPTLRGRIGDTFVVTLVNDADIGHSIDFHAGALAPQRPMRTIGPGEQLRYRFTATRAGIWLYHCSTMPMSMHIANGMFGAVIIDPPGLKPVADEFLLVQSEGYLGPQDGSASMDGIRAEQPDLVVFNGYPNQYAHQPLNVGVGARTRIWVLAAGPNRGTAFHIVGGQFDTLYKEGSYRLQPGSGGSQVLGLHTAQGGFVEFELPEPGSYPFVSHVMVDAERGAYGLLRAS